MKKILPFLFVLLTMPFLLSADADSLLSLLENADEKEKIEIYLELSEKYLTTDTKQCLQYGLNAYELATNRGDVKKQSDALFLLGFGHYLLNNYREAIKYFELALKLKRGIEDSEGEALTLNRLGNTIQLQGKYEQALEYYKQALKLNQSVGNKKELARTYANLGSIYRLYGNYKQAIEHDLHSLDLFEESGDREGIAWTSLNIARLFKKMQDYERALDYVKKSEELYTMLNDKTGITLCLKETGSIYHEKRDLGKAIEYSKKVLLINENARNKYGIANSFSNIGKIYYELGKPELAAKYLHQALSLKDSLNDTHDKASVLRSLANIYAQKREYKKALQFLVNSQEIAESQNLREDIKENSLSFSKIYSMLGDYKKALKYYTTYSSLKDSLNFKQISHLEMQYEFDKKQKQQEFEQQEKELTQQAKLKHQKTVTLVFITGFILMLMLAFIIYKNYKNKKKANEQLAFQNEEIKQQNEEIQSQRDEIEAQRDMARQQRDHIIEQTEMITDSIQYASRIQNALLPQEKFINTILPDYFIFFKPRNIVSGDFYWMSENGGKIIVAAADCTGHGVPGAFMSMLGVSFLNEIVNKNEVMQPDKILEELRKNVIDSLHQTSDIGSSKDGMDIALCIIDKKNNVLQFAGAHNPLYIIKEKELTELKADKMPIGIYAKNSETMFTNHEIAINKGDYIYLFSDGFIDQFGGTDGSKFRSTNFKNLLLEIHSKPMKEQKKIIEKTFEDWKGKMKQLDDILVMGIKI